MLGRPVGGGVGAHSLGPRSARFIRTPPGIGWSHGRTAEEKAVDLSKRVSMFTNPNAVRFCYLRVPQLQSLLKDPKLLDVLIDQLQVPGKPSVLKALSDEEKVTAIDRQIENYTRTETSLWRNVDPAEVLAASIFRSGLSER